MGQLFLWMIRRDLGLALRRKAELLTPPLFFLVAASLFPLGTGAERDTLFAMAPGVIWMAALLASLLGLDRLFHADYMDGTLEQMLLSVEPLPVIVAGKMVAHWASTGVPLAVLAPLLCLQYGLPASTAGIAFASVALGSLTLSALGAAAAALGLGLRGRNVLVPVLVLPLSAPVLIFGASALSFASGGASAIPQMMLLAAMALAALALLPYLTSLALRIAME